jgi:hypothetical protein
VFIAAVHYIHGSPRGVDAFSHRATYRADANRRFGFQHFFWRD